MNYVGLILLLLFGNPGPKSGCLCCASGLLTAADRPAADDAVAAQYSAAPKATTQPARGVVHGTIAKQPQLNLAEMVVYLEPLGTWPKPATPPRVRVSQKGAQFSPALTIVSVGQPVEFINDEDRPVEHNVFSNSTIARFDLGIFPPAQGRTRVFDKPGPVVLYCSIHKFMDGVVYVCPTPLFSAVDADGHYRIENVSPGKYTLKTWQRRRRFHEQAIALELHVGEDVPNDLNLNQK